MPTYQYACEHCGHRFDVRQRFSDEPLTVCPVCNSPIHRVISPVGIIFKGSGFYVTDNKNGSKQYTNGNGKKPENGTEKSTEAKPATEPSKSKTSKPEKGTD